MTSHLPTPLLPALLLTTLCLPGCFVAGALTQASTSLTTAAAYGDPTSHTSQEMAAYHSTITQGYTLREAWSHKGALERIGPISLDLQTGRCYVVTMTLTQGAVWENRLKQGLAFQVDGMEKFDMVDGLAKDSIGVYGPGGGNRLGCPKESRSYELSLIAYADAMKQMKRSTALGQGGFELRVWERVVTQAELERHWDEMAAEEERLRKIRVKEAQEAKAKRDAGCAQCASQYNGCIGAGRGRATCDKEWGSCSFRASSGQKSCERPM